MRDPSDLTEQQRRIWVECHMTGRIRPEQLRQRVGRQPAEDFALNVSELMDELFVRESYVTGDDGEMLLQSYRMPSWRLQLYTLAEKWVPFVGGDW